MPCCRATTDLSGPSLSPEEERLRRAAQKYSLVREAELKAESELAHIQTKCATLQGALRELLDEAAGVAESQEQEGGVVGELDNDEDPHRMDMVNEATDLASNLLSIRSRIAAERSRADACSASTKALLKSVAEHNSVKARLSIKRSHLAEKGQRERAALHTDALVRNKLSDRIKALEADLKTQDERLECQREANAQLGERVAGVEESGKTHRSRIQAHKARIAALREKRDTLQVALSEAEVEQSDVQSKMDTARAAASSASIPPPSHIGLLREVLASVRALRSQYGDSPSTPQPPNPSNTN